MTTGTRGPTGAAVAGVTSLATDSVRGRRGLEAAAPAVRRARAQSVKVVTGTVTITGLTEH